MSQASIESNISDIAREMESQSCTESEISDIVERPALSSDSEDLDNNSDLEETITQTIKESPDFHVNDDVTDETSEDRKASRGSSVVGKILEFKKRHQHAHTGNCMGCNVAFSSILKRRHVCLHCGNHFCSRCCSAKVSRACLGATTPAAQTETVPVCTFCYMYLTESKEKPES